MIIPTLVSLIIIVSYFGYWSARGMGSFYTSTPMMIAHRGTTKDFPENTIEAYNESIKLGYNGIELDVLSSKDGVIYCSHNHQLERETNDRGYIHEMVAAELDKIKTGAHTHPDNQRPIPRLENAVKQMPNNIRINIEIKFSGPFDFSTISILRKEIIRNKIKQPVLILSLIHI